MHRSYKIPVTDDDDDVTMLISSFASMSITHNFQFDLINAKKRDKKSYKNSGQIVVKSVKIEQVRMVRMVRMVAIVTMVRMVAKRSNDDLSLQCDQIITHRYI